MRAVVGIDRHGAAADAVGEFLLGGGEIVVLEAGGNLRRDVGGAAATEAELDVARLRLHCQGAECHPKTPGEKPLPCPHGILPRYGTQFTLSLPRCAVSNVQFGAGLHLITENS